MYLILYDAHSYTEKSEMYHQLAGKCALIQTYIGAGGTRPIYLSLQDLLTSFQRKIYCSASGMASANSSAMLTTCTHDLLAKLASERPTVADMMRHRFI